MRKQCFKAVSFILSLLIIINVISTGNYINAFAATNTTFTVESVTKQESSSTVNVNILVQNNTGIAGATLNVDYADCLTLVAATNGSAFSDLILTKPGTFKNHCRFLWDSVDGQTTKDGVILTLTFEVASDATGDLAVNISCNDGDVYDENLDTVDVQTVNGVVKTSSQPSETPDGDDPMFVVKSVVKSASSSIVNVDVLVKNNPGIAGVTLTVDYADELTLVAAENGEAFSDLFLTKPGTFKNHCRFLWDSVDGETTKDGVILTLTFEVAGDATGDLAVNISCNSGDVYNENLDTVEIKTVNGVIKTTSQSDDTPDSDEPMFEVKSVTNAKPSSTVSVDVLVKNNPGIAGATLSVGYSEGLTLISASNGSAFSDLSLTVPGKFTNPCRFLWDSISEQSLVNGTILTLVFEIDRDATGDLTVDLSCNDGDVYNDNLDTVLMKIKSGTITVSGDNYLFAKDGTTANVNYDNYFITGLRANLSSLDEYVYVKDGCALEYSDEIGTGCIVNVKKNNTLVETYIVVIFGDVNGDGWYDGMDAVLVSCLAKGMLTKDDVSEAEYMAADCNHDGSIDQLDVDILQQAGVLLSQVAQNKSEEELIETSSAYVEYLNLIDQNTTVDDLTDEPTIEPNCFQWLINFIVKFFNYIKLYFLILK